MDKPLKIEAIRAFSDNYIWLLHDEHHAVLVDPGDATPAILCLANLNLSLLAILVTHHHADHVGGIAQLAQGQSIPIYGPLNEDIAEVNFPVVEGDVIDLQKLNLTLKVMEIPGHTLGHIAFYAPEQGILFCGDTLFGGGCGRLFEGSVQQMFDSLGRIVALPDDTQIYCAHEYTIKNLHFSLMLDEKNLSIAKRIAVDSEKVSRFQPTLPTTVGLEKETNPFLRCQNSSIKETLMMQKRCSSDDPVEIFAAMRRWKNSY